MYLWIFQRASAVLLLVLLWVHVHLVKKFFFVSGGITYADIMHAMNSPLMKTVEISLFILASAHGLYGVTTIVKDTVTSQELRGAMRMVLWITGVLFSGCITIVIIMVR
jgi:succinate dehydrogenase hydrophobic anchor subunit